MGKRVKTNLKVLQVLFWWHYYSLITGLSLNTTVIKTRFQGTPTLPPQSFTSVTYLTGMSRKIVTIWGNGNAIFSPFLSLALLFPFVNPRVSCKFCLLCHLAVYEKSVTSVKKLAKIENIWTILIISQLWEEKLLKEIRNFISAI